MSSFIPYHLVFDLEDPCRDAGRMQVPDSGCKLNLNVPLLCWLVLKVSSLQAAKFSTLKFSGTCPKVTPW